MNMICVRGFRGFRYNPDRVGTLDNAVTPPYDVISPEERAALASRSPYNLVHALLPEARDGKDQYAVAAETVNTWIKEGAWTQDTAPSFTLLRQRFTDLEGKPQERRGFFAAVKLPEADEHYVLGHERTFDKPVEDRLRLTEATQANLGAVFVLYDDSDGALKSFLGQMDARDPDSEARTIDGVEQAFWQVPQDAAVTDFFAGKTLYIADGHHRFQTACAYRDAMREKNPGMADAAWDYCLMGFVAFDDPGLKIYPPHRLTPKPEGFDEGKFVDALAPFFDVQPVQNDLPGTVESAPGACVMGVAIHGGGDYLLTLKDIDRTELLGDDRGPAWRDLDVAVLHRGILERTLGFPEGAVFTYEKSLDRAMAAARAGDVGLSFILRATRADQICACAEAGERMPQKSTYFFPKLPSGGVVHRLV